MLEKRKTKEDKRETFHPLGILNKFKLLLLSAFDSSRVHAQ